MHDLMIFLISALAAAMQASLGFGYGVIGMALFPFVESYMTSVTLCTISAPLSNVLVTIRYRRSIQWRKLVLPLIFSLAASTAMSWLIVQQAEGVLKRFLGIFLVLLAAYFLLFKNRIKAKDSPLTGSICGFLSGFCGGFFGVNGPPAVIYFMAAAKGDSQRYLATAQTYFLVLNIHITIMRVISGAVSDGIVRTAIIGLGGVGVGTLVGLKIFKKLDLSSLYYFIYLFMAAMGMFIFWTA